MNSKGTVHVASSEAMKLLVNSKVKVFIEMLEETSYDESRRVILMTITECLVLRLILYGPKVQ